EEKKAPGFLAEAFAGFTVIFENRDLRVLCGLFCAQTVVAGASVVFEVSIALGLLGLSRSGLGYLNATLGIGGAIRGLGGPRPRAAWATGARLRRRRLLLVGTAPARRRLA